MDRVLKPKYVISVEEVERRFPNRRFIVGFGWDEYRNELYSLDDVGVFLEKGAFGRWDAVCYRVCDFKDQVGVDAWIKEVKAHWDQFTPPKE